MEKRIRVLLTKPTHDCHDRGVRHLARRLRDAGFEVIFTNFLLAQEVVNTAVQEDVDVIGLSVLSGSHVELTAAVLRELADRGAKDLPVVVGGTVPVSDHAELRRLGVRRVFTPSDFKLVDIVGALVDLCGERR